MAFNLDYTTIQIPCPKCGKKLEQKIGWLKRDKHVACPICGRQAVDTNELRRVEDRLRKEIGKLGGQ